MVAWIVDRRPNPKDRSLVNSQRFIDKAKSFIKASIDESVKKGSIDTMGGDGKGTVTISKKDIHEPVFAFDGKYGDHHYVLPGNKNVEEVTAYIEKDTIPKPEGGSGSVSKGSPDGDGVDEFKFYLSPEEWANILFDDMELPNMEEKNISDVEFMAWNKAGFKTSGSPANISIRRTLTNSFSRRKALNRPKKEEVTKLEDKLFDPGTTIEEKEQTQVRLSEIHNKFKSIPYIDTMDVRYHNLQPVPRPIYNAAMFCVMDCSGSMTEHMKDLAKRFYILLYRFLKIKYEKVEVIFIRHTHNAQIVDEDTFFYSPETGGTVVSTALEVLIDDMKEKHPPADWNIFVAQVSDGDNTSSDNMKVEKLLEDTIFPNAKYYAYLEVARDNDFPSGFDRRPSDLWNLYIDKFLDKKNFAMRKANKRTDIYPVFSELFAKKT